MGLVIVLGILAVITIIIMIVVGKSGGGMAGALAAGIIAAIIVALIGIGLYVANYANEQTRVCTVTSKDRGGDNGSYRVYTEDCGVLANKDALLRGKTKSADVWANIPDQGRVIITTVGYRNGVLSWFPNVLKVEAAK